LPLIEHYKGHHISFRRWGEHRILQHTARLELSHRHKPMLHEFLQVTMHNGGRSPLLLRHGSRRNERQHLQDPGICPIFLFSLSPLSVPLSFSRCRERGRESMADGTKGYRGAQGWPLALNPATSMVKRLEHLKHSKGLGKLSLLTSPTPHTSCPLRQQGIHKPYPQRPPQWLGGSAKA
jgi:hypothetical protein